MAFDLSTAKPVQGGGGFDLSTAKPVTEQQDPRQKTQALIDQRQPQSFDIKPTDFPFIVANMAIGKPPLPNDRETRDRLFKNVGTFLQREEAGVAGGVREGLSEDSNILSTLQAAGRGFGGEESVEFGDIARERGVPEGKSATIGLLASLGLPSSLLAGGVAKPIKPVRAVQTGVSKATAFSLGRTEALAEAEKLGFRNVLQKKYFNRNFPAEIQQRIEQNLDNLAESAGQKFNQLVEPFKNTAVDFINDVKVKVAQIAGAELKSPFKTGTKDFVKTILDGINSAKVQNLGDLLDVRRFLDDVIFDASGNVNTKFGKTVRNIINDILHKNETLKLADKEWTTLVIAMKEIGKKITSDTGENFLKRFDKLTAKQKAKLSKLEEQVGGEPFIDDLTNFSVAQKFRTDPSPSIFVLQILRDLLRPAQRAGLKASETKPVKLTTDAIDDVLRRVGTGILRRVRSEQPDGQKE